MPWSINGTEIFARIPDQFPMDTERILEWVEQQEDVPEFVVVDLYEHMPRRVWPSRDALMAEVQNYTWTMPSGAREPVWGGVTQGGLESE